MLPSFIFHDRHRSPPQGWKPIKEDEAGRVDSGGGRAKQAGVGDSGRKDVMASADPGGRNNDVWALGSGTAAVGGAVMLGGTLLHLRSEGEHRRRIDALKGAGGGGAAASSSVAAIVPAVPISSPPPEPDHRTATFDVNIGRLQEKGGGDNSIKVTKGGDTGRYTGLGTSAGDTVVTPIEVEAVSATGADPRLLESQGLRRAFRIIGRHRDRVAYGLLQQPGMYVCMLERTWLGDAVGLCSSPTPGIPTSTLPPSTLLLAPLHQLRLSALMSLTCFEFLKSLLSDGIS
jgi:hypothetical protein